MPCALVETRAIALTEVDSALNCLPLAAWLNVNLGADVFSSWATSHLAAYRVDAL
jgi:hypothetical protein